MLGSKQLLPAECGGIQADSAPGDKSLTGYSRSVDPGQPLTHSRLTPAGVHHHCPVIGHESLTRLPRNSSHCVAPPWSAMRMEMPPLTPRGVDQQAVKVGEEEWTKGLNKAN